ncbi:MAG: efflux RND transporter periplasmic adaptor subunit [Leptolyngbya sp. SIO1D8]|nr:efflux RND transporter periplasmic adaptor subunit [Leptolyngbya sp. SIO1D8]
MAFHNVTAKLGRGGYMNLLLGVGLGIAIAFIGSRLFAGKADSTSGPPVAETTTQVSAQTVTVAPVQMGQVTDQLTITGTVQPADLLEVTPQISGLQIRDVLVEEGDRVTAGQPLVILDDIELQTQIQQANAQIEVAQAEVQQEKANLAQSEAALAEAEANLLRYQSLADQGAVSAEELGSRSTEAITSQESVGVAQANVASAEATVRSRQAELARLQAQLTYTTVNAPTEGIVAERPASVGDVSSTSNEVITLIRNNQLELAAEVPQVQLSQVQVGVPAIVTATTDEAIRVEGTVQEIQPLVDPQTRTAQVIIQFPASDLVRSGMFLTAEIQVGQRSGLTVPATALLPQPDGSVRVYVLGSDNTAVARTVDVGTRLASEGDETAQAEILQGLDAGEQVIVAGASYVQAGDVVTVAE